MDSIMTRGLSSSLWTRSRLAPCLLLAVAAILFVAPSGSFAQTCGNGQVSGGELCDGANLGGQTCASRGFDAGTLSCAGNCLSFDTTHCWNVPLPDRWDKLTPTPTQRQIPQSKNAGDTFGQTQAPPLRAFSGGAIGGGKIWYFGGGHNGYAGNDVEFFDIAKNRWDQEYTPDICTDTGCSGSPENDCSCLYGGAGVEVLSPAGRPYTEHTYQFVGYSDQGPYAGDFVALLTPGLFQYDDENDEQASPGSSWVQQGPKIGGAGTGGYVLLGYDRSIGAWAQVVTAGPNRGVYRWEASNNSWVQLAGTMPDAGSPVASILYSAYDPADDVFYVWCQGSGVGCGGGWGFHRLDLTSNAATWTHIARPAGLGSITNGDWDSSRGALVVLDADGEIWQYSPGSGWFGPAANVLLAMPGGSAPATAGLSSAQQHNPIFFYDSTHDVFLLVTPNDVVAGITSGGSPVDVYVYEPAPFNAQAQACSDNIDNDGDGATDAADPGCTSANDTDETNCGDAAISGSEVCDGANLGGETCATQGFAGGTLGCANSCSSFDTGSCTSGGGGAGGANSVSVVGGLRTDRPTVESIGAWVEISGDADDDAGATLEFRVAGSGGWNQAPPLMRIRPERLGTENPPSSQGLPQPPASFAGSAFFLSPNTEYELRITVTDPDGGGGTVVGTARTQAIPPVDPISPNIRNVSTAQQLQDALNTAVGGDVIVVANGAYSPPAGTEGFKVWDRNSATFNNPIVIRGASKSGTILDCTGHNFCVNVRRSDYVHIENMTVRGVRQFFNYCIAGYNTTGLTVRNTNLMCDQAIDHTGGSAAYDSYIVDNTLTGFLNCEDAATTCSPSRPGCTTTNIKNYSGIHLYGQGHTVAYNTLKGFGGGVVIGNYYNGIHNIDIDIHNNLLLWTADDGFELDQVLRNIRTWDNYMANQFHALSFSPVWGGPTYSIRNIVYDSASSPSKMNNDSSGMIFWNNTFYRYEEHDMQSDADGYGFVQLGTSFDFSDSIFFENNIVYGGGSGPAADGMVVMGNPVSNRLWDYNGYATRGGSSYRWNNGQGVSDYNSIEAFRAGTGNDIHGVELSGPIFATAPPDNANYLSQCVDNSVTFELHANSNAVDTGRFIPQINANFGGSNPDLGAIELGRPVPVYGDRVTVAAVCGNGILEFGESCDGNLLGGMNCQDLGFSGGQLACDAECSFDTSSCMLLVPEPPAGVSVR